MTGHQHSVVSEMQLFYVKQPRSLNDSQAADRPQLLSKELPTTSPGVRIVNSVKRDTWGSYQGECLSLLAFWKITELI